MDHLKGLKLNWWPKDLLKPKILTTCTYDKLNKTP